MEEEQLEMEEALEDIEQQQQLWEQLREEVLLLLTEGEGDLLLLTVAGGEEGNLAVRPLSLCKLKERMGNTNGHKNQLKIAFSCFLDGH